MIISFPMQLLNHLPTYFPPNFMFFLFKQPIRPFNAAHMCIGMGPFIRTWYQRLLSWGRMILPSPVVVIANSISLRGGALKDLPLGVLEFWLACSGALCVQMWKCVIMIAMPNLEDSNSQHSSPSSRSFYLLFTGPLEVWGGQSIDVPFGLSSESVISSLTSYEFLLPALKRSFSHQGWT